MPSQVGIPGDLAALEVHRFQKFVEEFALQASKQTDEMISLTRKITSLTSILAWLTAVLTVLAGAQILLAIFH